MEGSRLEHLAGIKHKEVDGPLEGRFGFPSSTNESASTASGIECIATPKTDLLSYPSGVR